MLRSCIFPKIVTENQRRACIAMGVCSVATTGYILHQTRTHWGPKCLALMDSKPKFFGQKDFSKKGQIKQARVEMATAIAECTMFTIAVALNPRALVNHTKKYSAFLKTATNCCPIVRRTALLCVAVPFFVLGTFSGGFMLAHHITEKLPEKYARLRQVQSLDRD